jgi:uncharacterized protein YgbK (DUF1537 family)
VTVVDLGSRHLSPPAAAERAAGLPTGVPVAHKIDSTLRGNWARELVARHITTRLPVMLLPALPALGRLCVDGVVLKGGRPVHEAGSDARQTIVNSRPAEHLRATGALDVVELATQADLAAWLAAPRGYAVVDARSDADLEQLVAMWPPGEVLLAGTSAAIAAAAGGAPVQTARRISGPALVVCGSANPVARAQLAALAGSSTTIAKDAASALGALAARRDTILATPVPGGPIDHARADAEAARLAAQVSEVALKAAGLALIVVIGGDTAAMVLGNAPVQVLGSVAPGTAWLVSPRYRVPVVTRAGGFGDERALADLLWGTLRS